MASGDTLFILTPQSYTPPASNYATLDTVADASTPNMSIPVLDFDGSADESADWYVTVPSHYAGGGFTFSYAYAMSSTDGDAVEIEFRAFPFADASSILTADLGMDGRTAVNVADDPSANANEFNITTTGNLSHSDAGSPAAGAFMVIRATRDYDHAANGNDLQLLAVHVKET
tara:strand:- start:1072 stop:1590 length:519 start_codon:yes stop_codon:yes gene_type:complete